MSVLTSILILKSLISGFTMLRVKTDPVPLIRFHCHRLLRVNSTANCRVGVKIEDIL